MGETKLSFPCGMEIYINSYLYHFGDADYHCLFRDGCPIHGKKCSETKR